MKKKLSKSERKDISSKNIKIEPDYKYKAKLVSVVDGDTIEVIMDLGFYIELKERLRLAGVNTPEIFRVKKNSKEYKLGIKAKKYVEKRLQDNGNEFVVETKKRGKWRRGIAKIYLRDSDKTLNEELVEKGLGKNS
ncbi:MAG TPA: thermonuclease family protein [Candidatus Atribacteria bacterium]|nr:thermonuclease family protein [Candidatus Atribacteria bacterium]